MWRKCIFKPGKLVQELDPQGAQPPIIVRPLFHVLSDNFINYRQVAFIMMLIPHEVTMDQPVITKGLSQTSATCFGFDTANNSVIIVLYKKVSLKHQRLQNLYVKVTSCMLTG